MAAMRALNERAPVRAKRQLEAVLKSAPGFAPAHDLLGRCLAALNDPAGAEREFRKAVSLDRQEPAAYLGLAEFLAARGRSDEAIAQYRAALAVNPAFLPVALPLSQLLVARGGADEAVEVTHALAEREDAPPVLLEAHAAALERAGQIEAALKANERAAAQGSKSGEEAAGRLLVDLGRHVEAEAAWRAVLEREPGNPDAYENLARALWALTNDAEAAQAPLDEALEKRWSPELATLKAKLLNRLGRSAEAHAFLEETIAQQVGRVDPGIVAGLHAVAATAAGLASEREAAYQHAEEALRFAPQLPLFQALAAEMSLCTGRPERTTRLIDNLRRTSPLDQKLISLAAIAWRLLGDPRYMQIYDFDRFVRAYTIEPPEGWSNLADFMSDLRAQLNTLHDTLTDPLDQSTRNGTKTGINLAHSHDPIIKALMTALRQPIAEHIATLGQSRDPLNQPFTARNNGSFAYQGAWSVRLRPGGHHVNHIHLEGWLSSAFYIDAPAAAQDEEAHEGWIKFGEPSVPTDPVLTAERYVKPEPGRLVLFPSYMFHGTVPFSGEDRRLAFAFDVVPRR